MTFEILFVLLALLGMVIALVLDKMRPGMVLFSVVVLFLCAGILTPKEMLEGFSNKGMMTVAMLFLVSVGFERLLLFVTGMTNIRDVIPFPRTPRNAEF